MSGREPVATGSRSVQTGDADPTTSGAALHDSCMHPGGAQSVLDLASAAIVVGASGAAREGSSAWRGGVAR